MKTFDRGLDGLSELPTPSIMTIRRLSVQLMYQLEHQVITALGDEAFATFCEQNDVDAALQQWLRRSADLALQARDEQDRWIKAASTNWNLSRIGRVELAVLRVCLSELAHRSNVKVATIMADAAEIAKEFGTDRSPAFVHGILDSIYRQQMATATTEQEPHSLD